ncbi:MurR/RpiR family transcriptional regulator [Arenibaculum pallidiluteum]|uniref:MurR/RpiR family transcriptional regulator n=1 Tax=Arenibaculum pallidiluteum TaxID=2812559 RepID=UPI001A971C6D|nr:MurR/RpiR family transcriptional regulator [Arenibaculum pallidiluteum]
MGAEIGLLEHIQSIRGRLKPTLQAVADMVLARPADVCTMNIKELAAACDVSESSISRFVRGIGQANFRAFQLRMVEERSIWEDEGASDQGAIYETIGRGDTAATILTKVAHRNADVARACLSTLEPGALNKAAQMISEAQAIYFFAAGLSSLAAENALMRFSRIGKPAIFHRDRNSQLLAAAALRPGSVAIAITDSGRTDQTLIALTAAASSGVGTIAITSFADSPVARAAEVVLITPTGYAAAGDEPLYESMVSKFGQLLTIDVLYSLVAVQDYDSSLASVRRGDPYIQQSRRVRQHNGNE